MKKNKFTKKQIEIIVKNKVFFINCMSNISCSNCRIFEIRRPNGRCTTVNSIRDAYKIHVSYLNISNRSGIIFNKVNDLKKFITVNEIKKKIND